MSLPKPFTFDQIVALASVHAEMLDALKAFIYAEDMPEAGGVNRELYVMEFNNAKRMARAAIAAAEASI